MEITLEPKELILLIERFSDKSIVLSTKTIYLYINEQRYVCFANNLTVKQLNELCYELAKDLAIQEGYKEDIDAVITFDNIRITKRIILNDKSSSDRKFTYFMDDNIEDVRQEEQEEEINEYYDELLEQESTYDNKRNLIDNTTKNNEPVDIDELNNDLDEALKQ